MNTVNNIKHSLKEYLPYWALQYLKDLLAFVDPDLKKYIPLNYQKTEPHVSITNAHVLILGLRTYRHYDLAVFEKVLSDVLIRNGAKVTNLLCGNALDSCDADSGDEKYQTLVCNKCKHERNQFMKLYKNNFIFFRDFLPTNAENNIRKLILNLDHKDLFSFKYLNVNVSSHALDSVKRYYRNNLLNFEDDQTTQILRHKLIQGTLCVEAAKNIFNTLKPTHFISIHGVYVSWGPMTEYFRENGVKVCIHAKTSDTVGKVIFFKNVNNSIFEKDAWISFNEKQLSYHQKKQLNEFMQSKKNGNTHVYKLYSRAFEDDPSHFKIREKLSESDKTKYVLYPNLLWDIGLEVAGSSIFRDVNDWLITTIKYFKTKEDCYLFVKPHPAERMDADYTKEGVEYTVRTLLNNDIPQNVFFIPNNFKSTAYDHMDNDLIGITYNGTVGIEHAYFKKPIIVAGNIHYAEAGIVPKVSSIDEYLSLIDNPERLVNYANDNWDIIEKSCYYYYFLTMIDIPFYMKNRWLGHCINWEILKDYQSFIEKDLTMNRLANDIIQWKPFLSHL